MKLCEVTGLAVLDALIQLTAPYGHLYLEKEGYMAGQKSQRAIDLGLRPLYQTLAEGKKLSMVERRLDDRIR